jgi:multidrug efflux pump subunit AcrA (membrane-fusion protein)
LSQYNDAVAWINAQSGTNYSLYTEAPTPQPITPSGGGDVVTTSAGGTVDVFNQWLAEQQYLLEQQARSEAAAMERAQLAANTQLQATQAQAAAQLEAQRIANQGALERLKGQLAESLSQALMTNDMNRANLTLSVAQMAADPRSSVGFMEYLGHAGGGPTAISQNLAAGMTPSPVWEYMPETQGPSTQTQQWIDTLQKFIGSLGG